MSILLIRIIVMECPRKERVSQYFGDNIPGVVMKRSTRKVSEKDAFFFLLCRSSIIHFYFKTIFVFLNYLFPRSYPTEISKKEKSTDFFSQFP